VDSGDAVPPVFQSDVRMQLGRVGVLADQFEQRENKELKMVDSGDVLAPPLAKGRCSRHDKGRGEVFETRQRKWGWSLRQQWNVV